VITWDVAALGSGVAHLETTSWLNDGPDKNIVLAGHKTLANGRPGAFYALHRLHRGDAVMLSQGGKTFTYVVTRALLVDPSRFELTFPNGRDQLTLITCAGAFNAGVYAKRLVVIAERAS
jgi:LPXTG-site transpeptidase (sortase) family protein